MIQDLLPRSDAEPFLAPHFAALHTCFSASWTEWHEGISTYPPFAVASTRSRANMLNDLITNKAEEYFATIEGVVVSRKRRFLEVTFPAERIAIRFKKYQNGQLRTSGIPTEQRREIEAQQSTFDGMSLTYVVAGYLPDKLGDKLEVVALSCSYAGEVLWHFPLDEAAETAVVPARVVEPSTPIVRSKRSADKKRQVGAEGE